MRRPVGWLVEPFRCVHPDCDQAARARSEWCERHHQIANPPSPTTIPVQPAHSFARPPSTASYTAGCSCPACWDAYNTQANSRAAAAKAEYRRTIKETTT